MEDIKEKALDAWLQLLTAVNTERIVTSMTFNEAVVCNKVRAFFKDAYYEN